MKEIEQEKYALEVQEFLVWPSRQEFPRIVEGNQVRNLDLTVDDIERTVHLYGEPTPYLQGRMTRQKLLKDNSLARMQLALLVKLHNKLIELYLGIFHFKQCQFLFLKSGRVKYVDIKDVYSQKMENFI